MSIHFPNQSRAGPVPLPENNGTKKIKISTWQKWNKPVLFTGLALGTAIAVGGLLAANRSSTPQLPKAKIGYFLPVDGSLTKGFVTSDGMKIKWRFTPLDCSSCYRVCHQLKNTAAQGCATIDERDLADFLCSSGNLDSKGCDQIVQLVNQHKSRLNFIDDMFENAPKNSQTP